MAPEAALQGDANKKTIEVVVTQLMQKSRDTVRMSVHKCKTTAQLVGAGNYPPGRIPRDAADFVNLFVSLAGELSAGWFDMLAAMCDPAQLGFGQAQPSSALGRASSIIIEKPDRVQVTHCELTPMSPDAVPVVPGLVSPDQSLPPIRKARFGAAPGGSGLVLNIKIDPDHPAGVYTGPVIDSDTHRPIGTLTVRVGP